MTSEVKFVPVKPLGRAGCLRPACTAGGLRPVRARGGSPVAQVMVLFVSYLRGAARPKLFR